MKTIDARDLQTAAGSFPKDRLTFVTFHDRDGGVSAYLGPVRLAHEDTREGAEREARFVADAYRNGAIWARREFPTLAGILG